MQSPPISGWHMWILMRCIMPKSYNAQTTFRHVSLWWIHAYTYAYAYAYTYLWGLKWKLDETFVSISKLDFRSADHGVDPNSWNHYNTKHPRSHTFDRRVSRKPRPARHVPGSQSIIFLEPFFLILKSFHGPPWVRSPPPHFPFPFTFFSSGRPDRTPKKNRSHWHTSWWAVYSGDSLSIKVTYCEGKTKKHRVQNFEHPWGDFVK